MGYKQIVWFRFLCLHEDSHLSLPIGTALDLTGCYGYRYHSGLLCELKRVGAQWISVNGAPIMTTF